MQAEPLPLRYVAVVQVPSGSRLFCSDQYRDEWTSRLGYAQTYRALYDALAVAQRHGGQAVSWAEAFEMAEP